MKGVMKDKKKGERQTNGSTFKHKICLLDK